METHSRSAGDVFRDARPARRRRQWGVPAAIAAGGGLGTLARYGVGEAVPGPTATFLVNIIGCLVLGALMVYVLDVWPPRRYVRPFAGIGFLGGFTTFSAFAIDVLGLPLPAAAGYAVASLFGGLVATFCGIALARRLSRRPA